MSCNILKNNTITDKDFLETMIIHHKVAIDMSKLIINSSTNDAILSIARNIVFSQTKEIYFMKTLSIEINYSINEGVTTNKPFRNTFKLDYPTIFENLKCDESHFNLTNHTNHNTNHTNHNTNHTNHNTNHTNNNMTDSEYLNHMISHHNTALELSNLAIISTKNSQILTLAQTINLVQSKEIFELYFLEKSLKNHWNNLFKPF